jgi:ubiquinone/menaquinone biosynthesis C-methylase UbiE
MKNINDMYVKKDTLSTRINIHEKYSVNKYGWTSWVFDQYKFKQNMNILELGCGTGNIWIGKEKNLPENINITLTDISPLMIEKAKKNMKKNKMFSFQIVNIQNIPFDNKTFDVVIANHMLYHVPNMAKALYEIKRVLKDNGYFYTTTIGENSLKELQDIYKKFEDKVKFQYSQNCSFTLENGKKILGEYFSKIEQKLYIDSLKVTDTNDLMEYIISYNKIPKEINKIFYEAVKSKFNEEGIFNIRKDQGIFICKK